MPYRWQFYHKSVPHWTILPYSAYDGRKYMPSWTILPYTRWNKPCRGVPRRILMSRWNWGPCSMPFWNILPRRFYDLQCLLIRTIFCGWIDM